MMNPAPIPQDLWDQVPPAAQVAILGLILNYEQQLRALHTKSGAAPAPPPPLPKAVEKPAVVAAMGELIGKTFANFGIGPMLAAGNTGAIFRAQRHYQARPGPSPFRSFDPSCAATRTRSGSPRR